MKDITVQLNGRRMDWLFAKGTRSVPVTRDNRCGSDNMMTQHPKTIRGAIPGERNTLLKFFLYTSPFLHCFSRPGAQEVERIAHQCWGSNSFTIATAALLLLPRHCYSVLKDLELRADWTSTFYCLEQQRWPREWQRCIVPLRVWFMPKQIMQGNLCPVDTFF